MLWPCVLVAWRLLRPLVEFDVAADDDRVRRSLELLQLGKEERKVNHAEAERAFPGGGAASTRSHAKYLDVPHDR